MTFLHRSLFVAALLSASFSSRAQEYIRDLRYNSVQQYYHYKPQQLPPQYRASLPFVDDFSGTNVVPDQTKWIDGGVYINGTYPVNPPTINVATFDGLKSNGAPYNISGNLSPQPADSLTSQPIDLSTTSVNDSLFLSFFFEPQGLGDYPNAGDSIIVELKKDDSTWINVWSLDGFTSAPPLEFTQVIIPITDIEFFDNDFQFRFRNKAAVVGNNDHWHIDYVKLATGITAHTTINDVAVQYPPKSILGFYAEMPWNQFKANAGNEIDNELELKLRNNFTTTKNTSYGYQSQEVFTGVSTGAPPLSSFNFNAVTNETRTLPAIDISGITSLDSALIRTEYFANASGDVLTTNDTVVHYQHFRNELVYDDGSAEKAYGLIGIGGQGALRFHVNTPDTLQAIRVMWAHVDEDQSNMLVTFQVWQSLSQPAVYTGAFSHVTYVDSLNGFSTYLLAEPLPVTDSFYVGWIQDDANMRDMGLDRNTNMFSEFRYNLGAGWVPSINTGTPMIRAVLGSREGIYTTGIDKTEQLPNWNAYPNPVNDWVKVYGAPNNSLYELHDATGRLLLNGQVNDERINIPQLPQGIYLLRVTNGNATQTFKLVKP